MDRHKLKYLTPFERIHCVYCSYVNGLAAYFVKIAGATEKYWCGIKHKNDGVFQEPEHHKDFIEYGDEKAFRRKYGRK